jgi:hypothetical protein
MKSESISKPTVSPSGAVQELEIFFALRPFDEAGNIMVQEYSAAYRISEVISFSHQA